MIHFGKETRVLRYQRLQRVALLPQLLEENSTSEGSKQHAINVLKKLWGLGQRPKDKDFTK